MLLVTRSSAFLHLMTEDFCRVFRDGMCRLKKWICISGK